MSGLLAHSIGCNAGVVARARQVGLEHLQEGSVWRNVVGVSTSQGPAIFEPRDLGLWVACKDGEAGETIQQALTGLAKRSEVAPG